MWSDLVLHNGCQHTLHSPFFFTKSPFANNRQAIASHWSPTVSYFQLILPCYSKWKKLLVCFPVHIIKWAIKCRNVCWYCCEHVYYCICFNAAFKKYFQPWSLKMVSKLMDVHSLRIEIAVWSNGDAGISWGEENNHHWKKRCTVCQRIFYTITQFYKICPIHILTLGWYFH